MSFLAILWFCLVAFLLAVFAVLDGFDLGAGILYGLEKDGERKKRILASISPVWSGNEVWLLAGLGSLLAAFAPAYSALLSSLYVPVILVLMAILFRAFGVELRTKTDNPALIRLFDLLIFIGSAIPAWGIGLVAGNVLVGFPLDAGGAVQGSWLFFLNPFALGTSLASLASFTLHGATYVALKSEAQDRAVFLGRSMKALAAFAALAVACAVASPFALSARFASSPSLLGFWIFAVLGLVGYSGVFSDLRAKRAGGSFMASAIGLLSIVGMSASLLFPVLIPSRLGKENGITILSAAASDKSLAVMLVLALVGVPLIVIYTIIAYRSFRGVAAGRGEAH